MPYFLYKIFTGKKFELVKRFDSYREARDQAREQRKHLTPEDNYNIKVMFAKDPDEAAQTVEWKAQSAGNGGPLPRTATLQSPIWVAPFGRVEKRPSALLRSLDSGG